MKPDLPLLVVMIGLLLGGFGTGQWWAERTVRLEQAALHQNRIMISMPANEADAAKMMGLLKDLLEEVEAERSRTHDR